MSKKCFDCTNECHLINQGIYWCDKGHYPLVADGCPDYNEVPSGEFTSTSTITNGI